MLPPMNLRSTPILVHLLGAATASALAAYWALRLLDPAPHVVPIAPVPVVSGEPDARLAARLFGDVSSDAGPVARNVQVSGVFAAGAQSSAVVGIDGKPGRAVLLGGELSSGVRLVEVDAASATIEIDGARRRFAVPPLSIAKSSVAAPMYRREGNTLTAPTQEAVDPRAPGVVLPPPNGLPAPALAAPGPRNPPADSGARRQRGGAAVAPGTGASGP